MKGYDSLDSDLQALLERGRTIRRLPALVRARVLARARTTIAAGTVLAPAAASAGPARGRRLRLAFAASMALALGAVGTAAALRGGAPDWMKQAPPSSPPAVSRVRMAAPVPMPSTVELQPIFVARKDLEIQGRLLAVLRKYK